MDTVQCAGVAFTIDPNNGGNYYVINYDTSGSTDSITDGSAMGNLYYCFKSADTIPKDVYLAEICRALKSLEELFGTNRLDVEFAFYNDELYIFQVRPLCVNVMLADVNQQQALLLRIHDKIKQLNRPQPFLYGKNIILGIMPDWNPAEMIGTHPHKLAISLYKEIITDSVWAYQRDNYGYMNLRSFPLMMDFCGFPYIDVRVSFNSFIPADLDSPIAEKLVNYYLEQLKNHPEKHDKVEFDIVFSCYTFDLPKRINILLEYGFSRDEIHAIVSSLKRLTNNIIHSKSGLWRKDVKKIEILKNRYEAVVHSNLDDIAKIYWLLEDCKRYGTLPFAGLARAGFIAVQLLRSMVAEDIINQKEYDDFMNDLSTISSQMREDFYELSQNDFLYKYGHLRPGTYDITSLRYDEQPERYFKWNDSLEDVSVCGYNEAKRFKLSLEQYEHIQQVLQKHGLNDNVLGLFSFIKSAIEGRESSKFVFTRNLSKVLQLIGKRGEKLGFSLEDSSFIDIKIFQELYQSSANEKDLWERCIENNKREYEKSQSLVLPPLITAPDDVQDFFIPDTQPNFITQNTVEGEIVNINNKFEVSIDGKIAVIASADPGFDWIFSHNIVAFITEYGGINSHMAIRAAELNIPAVIGVGRKLYEKISKAKAIEIQAGLKKVNVLR